MCDRFSFLNIGITLLTCQAFGNSLVLQQTQSWSKNKKQFASVGIIGAIWICTIAGIYVGLARPDFLAPTCEERAVVRSTST